MDEDWDFPTLATVWDHRIGAVTAGAARLEALEDGEAVDRSIAALVTRVVTLARALDDGWLVAAATFMADDLYKTLFHGFVPSPAVPLYIRATAGALMIEVEARGLVLHYVVDATQPAENLFDLVDLLPVVFGAAGLAVTGPQLMALDAMQRFRVAPIDAEAFQRYRDLGHAIADLQIARCHAERRSSAYFNVDLDDDLPALSIDVALAPCAQPRTLVVLRNQPPAENSEVHAFPSPDITLPSLGDHRG